MDAVDHAGHVLLVIDVRGLREEGLRGKQLVTATGDRARSGQEAEPRALLCGLGLLVSSSNRLQKAQVKEGQWGHIISWDPASASAPG